MNDDEQQTPAWLARLRPTFTVGQRVRVRLSGECQHWYDRVDEHGRYGSIDGAIGHRACEDGATGKITLIRRENEPLRSSYYARFGYGPGIRIEWVEMKNKPTPAHVHTVWFDESLSDNAQLGQFAAEELEPLEAQ